MSGVTTRLEGRESFEKALMALAAAGRRSVAEEAKTNLKGVIRNAYSITPPMGGKGKAVDASGRVNWKGGRDAGKSAIRKDLGNAFQVTKQKRSKEDLLAWYLSVRDPKTKRIKGIQTRGEKGRFSGVKYAKRLATRGEVNAIQKYLFAKQGTVASGWSKAARFFGINPPGWVSQWSNKNSQFFFRENIFSLQMSAANITSHRDAPDIQSRLDYAFERQTQKMQNKLAAILARKAKEV